MVGNRTFISSAALLLLAACVGENDKCDGFEISSPSGQSFTVPELMAHATAMGMTQQEAETLIYLEGISSTTSLKPGDTLCIDGKPD